MSYRALSKCRGPEVGIYLTCLKNSKKDIVAGMQQVMEEGEGEGM